MESRAHRLYRQPAHQAILIMVQLALPKVKCSAKTAELGTALPVSLFQKANALEDTVGMELPALFRYLRAAHRVIAGTERIVFRLYRVFALADIP